MGSAKDSAEVVNFLTLFQRLKDWIDDDPTDIENLAARDDSIKQTCLDVVNAAFPFEVNERYQRQKYVAPVDPRFVEAWRDYESRYAAPLAGIWLADLMGSEAYESIQETASAANDAPAKPGVEARWAIADSSAVDDAQAIENVLVFAEEQAGQDWRWEDDFAQRIGGGISAWRRLKTATGFDLRGVFRRRELFPFVLVPRHVARHYSEQEKLSLFTHLQQAHDAFVFGVPFASLALMRSIMEVILKRHYGSKGNNLKDVINNTFNLPYNVRKSALHRLNATANDILHFNDAESRIPNDINLEREILSLLNVLRALIEGAPTGSR